MALVGQAWTQAGTTSPSQLTPQESQRLAALHNNRKIENRDDNRPRLKRTPGSGTGRVDADDNGKQPKSDEDERPTLKRRPSDQ